jgi:hypothetical protein
VPVGGAQDGTAWYSGSVQQDNVEILLNLSSPFDRRDLRRRQDFTGKPALPVRPRSSAAIRCILQRQPPR